MKKTIPVRSNSVFMAMEWYESSYGAEPSTTDFEKEFHCKFDGNVIEFNSIRDYTWFILAWGTANETL